MHAAKSRGIYLAKVDCSCLSERTGGTVVWYWADLWAHAKEPKSSKEAEEEEGELLPLLVMVMVISGDDMQSEDTAVLHNWWSCYHITADDDNDGDGNTDDDLQSDGTAVLHDGGRNDITAADEHDDSDDNNWQSEDKALLQHLQDGWL